MLFDSAATSNTPFGDIINVLVTGGWLQVPLDTVSVAVVVSDCPPLGSVVFNVAVNCGCSSFDEVTLNPGSELPLIVEAWILFIVEARIWRLSKEKFPRLQEEQHLNQP